MSGDRTQVDDSVRDDSARVFSGRTATLRDPKAEAGALRPLEADALVAGRYRLDAPIGAGGMGEVWSASDQLSGERVALKFTLGASAQWRAETRRERAALRWLRLPGVVRLRDDGAHDGRMFIAMDLVEGRPYPGHLGPVPAATALLEVLARVHAVGVLHRDLKPGNVLIRADGSLVLLDLGLAGGRALSSGPEQGSSAGTPRYMAPEQILGEEAGPAADLYAVGVLLFEGLVGRGPQTGDAQAMLGARLGQPSPPLSSLVPGVDLQLASLVDSLLHRDPQARPPSALSALSALGAALPLPHETEPDGQQRPRALRRLFAGPEPLHHAQSRAAAVLFSRTNGLRPRRELAAWARAGLAVWVDGRALVSAEAIEQLSAGLAVDIAETCAVPPDAARLLRLLERASVGLTRHQVCAILGWSADALDDACRPLLAEGLAWTLRGRLRARPVLRDADYAESRADQTALAGLAAPHSEARLRHRLAAGAPPYALLSDAADTVGALLVEGRLPAAEALAAWALDLARADEDESAERAILRRLCAIALASESSAALSRTRYALERALVYDGEVEALDRLLALGRAAWDGEADRAAALLADLCLPDPSLEPWLRGFEVLIARRGGVLAEEAALTALEPWAADPTRAAWLAGWWGNLRYRQGRYAEAAALHLSARKPLATGRLASLYNAAAASLEAQDLDGAARLGAQVVAAARRLHLPSYEALGLFVRRAAEYRLLRPLRPLPALVDAARGLGGAVEAPLCALEAAISWRAGNKRVAAALAAQAGHSFAALGLTEPALLMACLRAASLRAQPAAVLAPLAEAALAARDPSFAAQCLGLLRRAALDPPPVWREAIVALAPAFPQPAARLDVLSFEECLARGERVL